jgi:L-lactate dehydrogenase complex protein LldF
MLRQLARKDGMIARLPLGGGWTQERDMPAPAGRTFRELYRQGSKPAAPHRRIP